MHLLYLLRVGVGIDIVAMVILLVVLFHGGVLRGVLLRGGVLLRLLLHLVVGEGMGGLLGEGHPGGRHTLRRTRSLVSLQTALVAS